MADNPQKIPSHPVACLNPALAFVRSPYAKRKNNNVREPKTTCKARLIENVPINITAVNNPHIARYAAMEVSFEAGLHPIFGRTISTTSESDTSATSSVA